MMDLHACTIKVDVGGVGDLEQGFPLQWSTGRLFEQCCDSTQRQQPLVPLTLLLSSSMQQDTLLHEPSPSFTRHIGMGVSGKPVTIDQGYCLPLVPFAGCEQHFLPTFIIHRLHVGQAAY